MTETPASTALASSRQGFDIRIPITLALIGLADWLFYDRVMGVSVALFLAAVAVAMPVTDTKSPAWRNTIVATACLVLGLLPSIETFSPLTLLFALLGIAGFALSITGGRSAGWSGLLRDVEQLIASLVRLVPDIASVGEKLFDKDNPALVSGLVMWIVPIGLGGVFLMLFSSANPLIESWLSAIDLRSAQPHLSLFRMLFWIAAATCVWGLINLRRSRKPAPAWTEPKASDNPAKVAPASLLFGKGAIIRSLVVFNLLFALQSGLDLAFLWRGVSLPGGLSYATYAHRGAYPLMATALLAAAFVIAAMRPGTAAERSPVVRGLVFAWTAQNILLVLSAILRLDLYVATYSLTYMRVAAFVWMGLVGVGLVLIVARIALNRSNAWLIAANAFASLATLYACCFVNFAHIVASYNVAHSSAVTGQGIVLDWEYLASLGPHAIPAMDAYPRESAWTRERNQLADGFMRQTSDWRAWTYRDHRLKRYLDQREAAAPK